MSADETFISHLVELRARLLRACAGILLGFLPCAYYARELYSLLAQPLLEKLPQGGQMIATEVVTPFFVPMKGAMMAAFIITLPHTLYQIWAFVAPGLVKAAIEEGMTTLMQDGIQKCLQGLTTFKEVKAVAIK